MSEEKKTNAHPVMTDEQVYAILNAGGMSARDPAEHGDDDAGKDEAVLPGTEASKDHAAGAAEKNEETADGISTEKSLADMSLSCFSQALSSDAPVPGGGGAAAFTAALAASAGAMVGHLTVGRRRYAAVWEDMERLVSQLDGLRKDFLSMIDGDAKAFRPLAEAYAMPRATFEEKEKRNAVMETCLAGAAQAPLELIRALADLVRALEEVAEKGSALAVSDAGVAASLAGAAMKSALLNVYANTKLMKDRRKAKAMNTEASELVDEYAARAEYVYGRVTERLIDQ